MIWKNLLVYIVMSPNLSLDITAFFLCLLPLQPPGFNFDMESLNLPGGPGAGAAEQCSIMWWGSGAVHQKRWSQRGHSVCVGDRQGVKECEAKGQTGVWPDRRHCSPSGRRCADAESTGGGTKTNRKPHTQTHSLLSEITQRTTENILTSVH